MIKNKIYIEKYDWTLTIFYCVSGSHVEEIIDILLDVNCPNDILDRVYSNLQDNKIDTGFTYSNKSLHQTVMVIGFWSDKSQFFNSFTHEMRHFIDDVGDYYNIDSEGEEIAYLTGDTNQMLWKDVKMFLCDCPKCNSKIQHKIKKNGYNKSDITATCKCG